MKLIIDIPKNLYSDYKYQMKHGIDRCNPAKRCIANGIPYEEQPTGEWIPVKYRPCTDEEFERMKELFGEDIERDDFPVFDCPMPEDEQEILICSHWGVEKDTAHYEDGEYWLDCRDDWKGVEAWMPSPEPYKKGGEKE